MNTHQGGSKEIFSTNAHSKDTVLVLKKRFGFIKLAIKHGSPLVRLPPPRPWAQGLSHVCLPATTPGAGVRVW